MAYLSNMRSYQSAGPANLAPFNGAPSTVSVYNTGNARPTPGPQTTMLNQTGALLQRLDPPRRPAAPQQPQTPAQQAPGFQYTPPPPTTVTTDNGSGGQAPLNRPLDQTTQQRLAAFGYADPGQSQDRTQQQTSALLTQLLGRY